MVTVILVVPLTHHDRTGLLAFELFLLVALDRTVPLVVASQITESRRAFNLNTRSSNQPINVC